MVSRVPAVDRGPEWFETVFSAYFDRVLRYALLRTDRDTAREVASQTFLIAWRRRYALDGPILPWLLTVARNVVAEQRRSAGRRRRLVEKVAGTRHSRGAEPDPAEAVAHRDATVLAFLRLSESDREVLRLVAWDRLSNEEAAEVLGCTANSFAVRLSRARARLEAGLSAQEADLALTPPNPLEAT